MAIGPKIFIITSILVLSNLVRPCPIPGNDDVFGKNRNISTITPTNDFPIDIKIFVGYDNEWENEFGANSIQKIEELMKRVQEIFRWESLERSFILKIVGREKYNTNFRSGGDFLILLKPLVYAAKVEANVYLFLSIHDSNTKDPAGTIGGIGGACYHGRYRRTAVVEHKGKLKQTALVVAHEIGHAIGMKHDRKGCTDSIMHENNMGQSATWTSCNRNDYEDYEDQGTCHGKYDLCMGGYGGECMTPHIHSYDDGKFCCSKPTGGFYSNECPGESKECTNPPCRDRRAYFEECPDDYPYAYKNGRGCCEKRLRQKLCIFGCTLDTGFYSDICENKISCRNPPCRNTVGHYNEFYGDPTDWGK